MDITVIESSSEEFILLNGEDNATVLTEMEQVTVVVSEEVAPIIIEVSEQGPEGQKGADGFIPPKGPSFTYTSGLLTRIDYDNGSFKEFSYTSGLLTQLDFTVGAVTTRKTFNYTSGVLTSIDEVTI